jgi:hypothetical protein
LQAGGPVWPAALKHHLHLLPLVNRGFSFSSQVVMTGSPEIVVFENDHNNSGQLVNKHTMTGKKIVTTTGKTLLFLPNRGYFSLLFPFFRSLSLHHPA